MINKFATIESYEFKRRKIAKSNTKKKNMCLVYTVWSNPLYAKLLYLSLYSQFKYSDVASIDIKIFVAPECLDAVKDTVSYFPDIDIVVMPTKFTKYTVTNHKSLLNYKKIAISDCDTLLFGKNFNLYQKLIKAKPGIYMMTDPDVNTRKIFISRISLTFPALKVRKSISASFLDF